MTDASSSATSTGRAPRLIKRYANRKMYDTERSCYITLDEVADMVRAGEELRVIDNKTKADLTEVTLTQALLTSERKKRGSVSIDSLRDLFAQGGDLLQTRVGAPVARAASEAERTVEKWRNEAERKVGRMLGPKKPGAADGEPAAADAAQVEVVANEPNNSPPRNVDLGRGRDEWQTRIDERVRLLVSALTAPAQTSDEVARLQEQVARLEARVQQLEEALAGRAGGRSEAAAAGADT